MTAVALVPARAGSKRLPGKNVRDLGGHPVLAYTIAAALGSGAFDAVVVSTDDDGYADIARRYGAEVPFLRPAALATDRAPDIDWVDHTLRELLAAGRSFDVFSILRPTSPFRTASTITRAIAVFRDAAGVDGMGVDSLRAVEPCVQHPGKMWRVLGERLVPVLPVQPDGTPWHSQATQALPPVFVQNASLEIARTACVLEDSSISGERIVPFFTEDHEGFDLNDEHDWARAERLVASGEATLPEVAALDG